MLLKASFRRYFTQLFSARFRFYCFYFAKEQIIIIAPRFCSRFVTSQRGQGGFPHVHVRVIRHENPPYLNQERRAETSCVFSGGTVWDVNVNKQQLKRQKQSSDPLTNFQL